MLSVVGRGNIPLVDRTWVRGVRQTVLWPCGIIQTGRIVMAAKDTFSAGATAAISGLQSNRSRIRPLPKPEEGLRLMHAFVAIQSADLREAVVKFVEELSKTQRDSS